VTLIRSYTNFSGTTLAFAIETGIANGTLVTIIASRSVAFVIRGRAKSGGWLTLASHFAVVLYGTDDESLTNTDASFASI